MLTYPNGKTLFVDVDGTLVLYPDMYPNGEVPNQHFLCHMFFGKNPEFETGGYVNSLVVSKIKAFKAIGYTIVVWSQSGGDWAEHVIKKLSLEAYVDVCMSKPLWIIDDLEPSKWLTNRIVP